MTVTTTPFEAMTEAVRLVKCWNMRRDETTFETGIVSDRPAALFLFRLHKVNLIGEAAEPLVQYFLPDVTIADRVTAALYHEACQRIAHRTSGEHSDSATDLVPPPRPVSRAVTAAEDLIRWLDITYDELERLTGISRSTFFYWKRKGTDPRPSTVRRLLRVHSIVGLAVRQFGLDGAQAWLSNGAPTAWDLFAMGDLAAVEQRAQALFFGRSGLSRPGFGSVGSGTDELVVKGPSGETRTVRRSQRRPRRGRPGT